MIVIGVDVHKHTLTAVAVDGSVAPSRSAVARSTMASSAGGGRWPESVCVALEDCRHVTRGLERALLAPASGSSGYLPG